MVCSALILAACSLAFPIIAGDEIDIKISGGISPSPISSDAVRAQGPWTFDLDADPETAWQSIVQGTNFTELKNFIDVVFRELNMTKLRPRLEKLLENAVDILGKRYAAELRGIAKASGLAVADVLVLNLFYEVSGGCTSIVASDYGRGSVIHGRNLDYSIKGLRPITAVVNFVKNQKVVYSCTTYVGYVGCLTGSRPGGWSVSVNERDSSGKFLTKLLLNLLETAFEGGQSIGIFLRDLLETKATYKDALQDIQSGHLVRPVYLTVAGVGIHEGAVITRDRNGVARGPNGEIGVRALSSNQTWVLQTNDDSWDPPADDRRNAGNGMMAFVCRDATAYGKAKATCGEDGLFATLSSKPILNYHTTYTTLMSAAWGRHTSVVRHI